MKKFRGRAKVNVIFWIFCFVEGEDALEERQFFVMGEEMRGKRSCNVARQFFVVCILQRRLFRLARHATHYKKYNLGKRRDERFILNCLLLFGFAAASVELRNNYDWYHVDCDGGESGQEIDWISAGCDWWLFGHGVIECMVWCGGHNFFFYCKLFQAFRAVPKIGSIFTTNFWKR